MNEPTVYRNEQDALFGAHAHACKRPGLAAIRYKRERIKLLERPRRAH